MGYQYVGIGASYNPQPRQTMYLHCPLYHRTEYQLVCLRSCDWSTDLALGILESLADFSCCQSNGYAREVNPKV